MTTNLLSITRRFTAILLFSFFFIQVYAGDCATASVLPNNNTWVNNINFTNNCPLDPGYSNVGCQQDVWFKFSPNTPGTNYNMRFHLNANSNSNLTYYRLLYSVSQDANDPCGWSGSPFAAEYHLLETQTRGAGGYVIITADGLDGSGTYFLVVENTGTGGSVSGRAQPMSTCSSPANDRCSNATNLVLGAGIDSQVPSGSGSANVAWSDGVCGATTCATAQRPTTECGAAGQEDYYWNGGCELKTTGKDLFGISACNSDLDNSVWYSMNVPSGINTSDWYVHFGNVSCAGGASMKVTLLDDVTCNDASTADILDRQGLSLTLMCETIGGGNSLPTPDATMGPVRLNNGTIHILVDGENRSQCSFCLVMSRDYNNFLLPVTLSSFSGVNKDFENHVLWETSSEQNSDYFAIQRSLDGNMFETIGHVKAQGNSDETSSYSFIDNNAPLGVAYYRLRQFDIDGEQTVSESIEIIRAEAAFEMHKFYPNPTSGQLFATYSALETGTTEVQVADMAGRIVSRQVLNTVAGTNQAELSLAGLESGVYFVRFQQGDHQIVRKIIKK